tara:strand:+ start:663 stop:1007 length:345 start_codon:yes stop_codon:yes gene_type:complete
MTINKIDLAINNSFNEFVSKETTEDFIWIGIIKKPNALKYHWDIYTMTSENYLRGLCYNKESSRCAMGYDEFYEYVDYLNAKTIRSAYAKSTEMLIEHLNKNPNSKVSVKEIEL